MCNVEEKCKAMRNAALRVLTAALKEAKESGNIAQCRKVMNQIDTELSEYQCQVVYKLKVRIKSYYDEHNHTQKMMVIDMLIAELEAFIEE